MQKFANFRTVAANSKTSQTSAVSLDSRITKIQRRLSFSSILPITFHCYQNNEMK